MRPPRPGAAYVWVDGYWQWNGGWNWVPGHWEAGRAGYVWTPPVARRVGGRVVYHRGYWRRSGAPPPRVYRAPGRVRVSRGRRGVSVRARPAPRRGASVRVQGPRRGVRVQTPQRRPPPRRSVTVEGRGGRSVTVESRGRPPARARGRRDDRRRGGTRVRTPERRGGGARVRPR